MTNPSKIIELYVDSDGVAKEIITKHEGKEGLIITESRLLKGPIDKYTQHFHLKDGKLTKVMYSPVDCTYCVNAIRDIQDVDTVKKLPYQDSKQVFGGQTKLLKE